MGRGYERISQGNDFENSGCSLKVEGTNQVVPVRNRVSLEYTKFYIPNPTVCGFCIKYDILIVMQLLIFAMTTQRIC